ncbi:short chain dehydrogenase [Trichoderma arundinaceum]|uniref:Short chain dehydrogenase n=1 Tax=Trichoderma arundinaceum TaxID=490622 RepID=A0A395P163_TRIAR|nr:short chain dehydrogenase [Trichoderma arundinaceum]
MAAAPWPSPTKTWHDDTYPAIDPTRPELSLRGKTAVITGGGSGIGGAIAQSFAKAGVSRLALIGRRLQVLEDNKAKIAAINPQAKILLLQGDIVNGDQIQQAFETVKSTFGEPHILVNNAAYFDGPVSALKDDVDTWYQAFEINVKGSLRVVRSFLSVAATSPRILNVSSGQVHLDTKFFPGMSAYLSSKMAQLRMFDAIQVERPDVIIVNFHPGRVLSEMSAKVGRTKGIDTLELSGDFGVWAVSDEATFLKGKMAWVNWDVDELKAKKDEIANSGLLTVALEGWPFSQ